MRTEQQPAGPRREDDRPGRAWTAAPQQGAPHPYVAPLVHHRVQHVLVPHQLRHDHLAGLAHEGAGRRDLPQRPVDEDRHPVGQPQRLVGPVGHVDQRGSPVAQRELDIGQEPGPGRDVQCGGGLVEQQDAGPGDQRPRQADALRLATGEGAGPPTGQVRDAERVEGTQGALAPLRAPHLAPRERQLDVTGDRGATQERGVLRDVADVAAHPDPFAGGRGGRVRAADAHAAAGRWLDGGEEPQHRRLPRAVGPEDREALAGVDGELVDRQDLAGATAVTDVDEAQGRDHVVPRCCTVDNVAFTTNARTSSTAAKVSADPKSPRRTSSTTAVVMT